MRPVITARLVVVVSVTTALSSIGASARRVSPISTRTTGGPFQYEVVAGDSLVSLGARYGIDPREIALANGLKPGGAIAPGLTLRLDSRHIVPVFEDDVVLVINVPQRMLFFSDNALVAGFPVALGRRDWPTPMGDFSVVAKEESHPWLRQDAPGRYRPSLSAGAGRRTRTHRLRADPARPDPGGHFPRGPSRRVPANDQRCAVARSGECRCGRHQQRD
jgi:hypothetical protein